MRARRLARAAALCALALSLAGPALAADHGGGDHGGQGGAGGHGGGGEQGGGGGHGGAPAAKIEPLPVEPRGLPVQLQRTLQLLQDRIARGDTQAHLAQRPLIAHIEGRLIGLEPETWAQTANLRAAVAFALAGGGPGVLRRVIEAGTMPDAEASLLQGSLAYLEGREKEARRLLMKIDAQGLPLSLGGQLALVQAALVVRDDPAQSLKFLDVARLLAPGTLVEEGALRREVFILAQSGDVTRFEALSVQYLRRYRRSVYAGNFRQRFAAALTRLDYGDDQRRIARLGTMLAEIEPDGRRELYLMVARAAIEQGKTATAIFAASQAAPLTAPGTVEAAQARLYRAAAAIVAPESYDGALAVLRGLDRAALPAADATLLDAALTTAVIIRSEPPPAPAAQPEQTADAKRPMPPTPAIARAQQVIGQIDELMQRTLR
ncbi:chemotaxis protein MotC [Methylobacterium sp. ID0610]|uniref:chemotaxis protein MotC n=1 Tax=Methylobacterium carpenticola TaxID=3344827 RepID=UPI0036AC2A03